MSKLYNLRQDLRDSIIAQDIGWTEDSVIIKRQTSLWNDVATAIDTAKHGCVLHIGIAQGKGEEDEGLLDRVSVILTILTTPQVDDEATPEEDLFEDLLNHVNGLYLTETEHCNNAFKYISWTDQDVVADGGTRYMARQIVFSRRLDLTKDAS